MRILLVSQFWPGPDDPDLGVFVHDVAAELGRRGHAVERAVVDHRRPGRDKHARLAAHALRLAARGRFDVVFAHFLAPAGVVAAAASLVARAPLVVMAHGQDVRNLARPAIRAASAAAVRRSDAVIANSAFLRDRLVAAVPAAAGRTSVIDCGVDLERFAPRDQAAARVALGLPADLPGPVALFVGGLHPRKNVVRLRDAFVALGRGTLLVVGDGEQRRELEGVPGVRLGGARPHAEIPAWIGATDLLVLPSVEEPFGQVLLEAMAGGRSVVATRTGGPPEFVGPGAGVLVDPLDVVDIARGLERAAAMPVPNPAARAAAEPHGVRRQVDRMEALLRSALGAR